MDVPIAGMEDVGNPQVVTQADGRDIAKDLREPGSILRLRGKEEEPVETR